LPTLYTEIKRVCAMRKNWETAQC